MKRLSIILLSLLLMTQVQPVQAQGPNTTIVTIAGAKCIVSLPDDFATSGTKKYPLLVFYHGLGEGGTDPSVIYNNSGAGGPSYFIAHNQWPSSFINPADGLPYKFIVISPQGPAGQGVSWSVMDPVADYAIANFRADITRYYITGLSEGGQNVFVYTVGCCGVTPKYAPACVIPMSMAGGKPDQSACNITINKNVHAWGFGSPSNDGLGLNTQLWMLGNQPGNSCNCTGLPNFGRFTTYTSGHCCWNTFYNPTYTESVNGTTMSIYQYALQFQQGGSTPVNVPPVVSAGSDQNVTLPQDSVQLVGSASDADGTIASYAWVQTAGTTATIVNPGSASTMVRGMGTTGLRTFQLTVTDNLGAHTSDAVNITVFPISTGTSKMVNVNLYGSALFSDPAWNNWQITSSLSASNFTYSDGTASTIDATLSAQTGYADNGGSYPTTMCPPGVGRDCSYATGVRTFVLTGLDNSKLYDLSFYASRAKAGETTRFTVGNVNVDIVTNSNFTNAATFLNTPPAGGQITVTMTALATYTYLNGFSLVEHGSSNVTPVLNQPPIARAGSDQVITQPNNSTSLSGAASTDDHNIVSYHWSILSGPSGAILSKPDSVVTNLTNMGVGTYQVKLLVTDDSAATGADTVAISVITPPVRVKKNITKVLTGEYATSFLVTEPSGARTVYATTWWSPLAQDTFRVYNIAGVVDGDGGQYYNIARDSLGKVYIIGKASDGTNLVNPIPTDTTGAPFTGNTNQYGWFQCWLTIKAGAIWYWGLNTLSNSLQLNNGSGVFDIIKPMKLTPPQGGQPIIKVVPMDNQGTINGGPWPLLMALCSDGSVWGYFQGSATPVQIAGLSAITDIGINGRNCYFAASATDIKAWGPFASYAGLADGTKTPTSVLAQWTAAGFQMPVKQMINGWSEFHMIDNNNYLFGNGDTWQGENGNGTYWPTMATYMFNNSLAAFAWSFTRKEKWILAPVLIPGTYLRGDGSISLAFYHYWFGCNGGLYSNGRNKEYALGNGLRKNNDANYSGWGCIPSPTLVSPSTVIWNKPEPNFDPTAPLPPSTNAGAEQCIVGNTVSLSAALSAQQSGTITGYAWSMVSGPNTPAITTPGAVTTTVTGLTTGTYVFRVQATSSNGLSAANDVNIYVNNGTGPTVTAGANPTTIMLPTNLVQLVGTAQGNGGATIVSTLWSKLAGGNATILAPSQLVTNVVGLEVGTYIFQLTVTDSNGNIGTGQITVQVNQGFGLNGLTFPHNVFLKPN